MLKKIFFASALLVAASSANIAIAGSAAPYVGAGLGITVNTSNNGWGSFRGVPFNLFAGYGGLITDNFYLAGELSGTPGTAEMVSNGPLKTTYGYGISVIPGLMLSEHTMAFARAGVVRTHFSNVNVPPAVSSTNTNQTGGQLGLGLQTNVTQNIDLRGEYNFIAYRSINRAGASFSPRSDIFNVGIIYKFD